MKTAISERNEPSSIKTLKRTMLVLLVCLLILRTIGFVFALDEVD